MLNMSHVKVTKVELALPFPHLDQDVRIHALLSIVYGLCWDVSVCLLRTARIVVSPHHPHSNQSMNTTHNQGNVPVTSMLLLSNSNPFPVKTGTTHVDIFAGKRLSVCVG